MRRRLDLAATLVARPQVLFLDEPTTGLDPRARNELWAVLDTLVGQGTTLLLTTQYLEEADRLADDILVVDHGKVIARGDARSLKRQVGGDNIGVTVVDPADLDRTVELLRGCTDGDPVVDRPLRTVTAPTSAGVAGLASVANTLAGAGLRVEDLSLRQPTLDEVFLTLTGVAIDRRRRARGGSGMTAPTDTLALSPDAAEGIAAVATPAAADELHPPRGLIHDVWVVARRGLIHMKRQPEALSDATIQPIMFVVLFAYVFGGAIDVPGGGNYREFLMGGIMAQTLVFTAFGVAMSIANDRKNQAVDRFRSLPIAKGAVLGGHAVANVIKSLLPDRHHVADRARSSAGASASSVVDAVAGYLLMVAFAFAMIWIGVLLGSLVAHARGRAGHRLRRRCSRSRSSPARSCRCRRCPGRCKAVAQWNPITTLSDALRELFGNPNTPGRSPATRGRSPTRWPTRAIWIVGIVVVCAPLAVRAYSRSIAK